MSVQTHALQPDPIPRPIVAAPVRPISPEAIAALCVFALAGLIWLAVGWAVMRGGSARRAPSASSHLRSLAIVLPRSAERPGGGSALL